MKKTFIVLFAASSFLMSCGPSAEEKAAEQQRVQDSIALHIQDSLAMEQQRVTDSINAVVEKMRTDSIAMAAEMANMKKGSSKGKTTTPPPSKGTGVSKGGTEINTDGTRDTTKKGVTKGGKPISK